MQSSIFKLANTEKIQYYYHDSELKQNQYRQGPQLEI